MPFSCLSMYVSTLYPSIWLTVCFNCLSGSQLFCSCASHHWTEASLIWTTQQRCQSLEDIKLSLLLYTIQFRFCFIMRLPSRAPSFIPPSSAAIKNQLRRVNIKWQERRCEKRIMKNWRVSSRQREGWLFKMEPRKMIVCWEVKLKRASPPHLLRVMCCYEVRLTIT